MKALTAQPELPHKSLEVIFISPPGVGQKGLRGLGKVGRRLAKVIQTLGLYDQFHIFPLTAENNASLLQKRKIFLDEWLPRIITDSHKRERVCHELQITDAELLFLESRPTLKKEYASWYQHKRHQVMKRLLEEVINGKHILEETHLKYLKSYGEFNQSNIKSRLANFTISFELAVRTLKILYRSIDSKIVETFEFCQKLGINLKIGVVIFGKDELVYDQDYASLMQLALSKHIPIYRRTFENQEHSSVAYNWELIDALETIRLGE